ncbi:hypothetical protein H920_06532 [Fukomys damarensis]|uniref:Uncharacterized protein n=1 Tax=Fukomys damarensis TaxID=885580 RepID=A0A091DIK1_FUKDA|nr:hypothetical protein H920_06532 [Fukomys damarensis]
MKFTVDFSTNTVPLVWPTATNVAVTATGTEQAYITIVTTFDSEVSVSHLILPPGITTGEGVSRALTSASPQLPASPGNLGGFCSGLACLAEGRGRAREHASRLWRKTSEVGPEIGAVSEQKRPP